MFTPFIQYTIDDQNLTGQAEEKGQNILSIAEAVGCLETGALGTWLLTNASDPIVSETQATSATALQAAAAKPLGKQRDQLLGVDVFNPSNQERKKVAVKGVLIKDPKGNRLNVTSLRTVAPTCP
jgi:hypothetical protein